MKTFQWVLWMMLSVAVFLSSCGEESGSDLDAGNDIQASDDDSAVSNDGDDVDSDGSEVNDSSRGSACDSNTDCAKGLVCEGGLCHNRDDFPEAAADDDDNTVLDDRTIMGTVLVSLLQRVGDPPYFYPFDEGDWVLIRNGVEYFNGKSAAVLEVPIGTYELKAYSDTHSVTVDPGYPQKLSGGGYIEFQAVYTLPSGNRPAQHLCLNPYSCTIPAESQASLLIDWIAPDMRIEGGVFIETGEVLTYEDHNFAGFPNSVILDKNYDYEFHFLPVDGYYTPPTRIVTAEKLQQWGTFLVEAQYIPEAKACFFIRSCQSEVWSDLSWFDFIINGVVVDNMVKSMFGDTVVGCFEPEYDATLRHDNRNAPLGYRCDLSQSIIPANTIQSGHSAEVCLTCEEGGG